MKKEAVSFWRCLFFVYTTQRRLHLRPRDSQKPNLKHRLYELVVGDVAEVVGEADFP